MCSRLFMLALFVHVSCHGALWEILVSQAATRWEQGTGTLSNTTLQVTFLGDGSGVFLLFGNQKLGQKSIQES